MLNHAVLKCIQLVNNFILIITMTMESVITPSLSDGKIEITLEKVKEEDDKEKEFVSVKIKDNGKIF